MATNPITSETSLKSKPQLRLALIGLWLAVTIYTVTVYVLSVPVIFWMRVSDPQTSVLDLSEVLFTSTDIAIDIFIAIGFLLTAIYLFTRRSDDWFVIFTSMFLVTFAGRISSTVNNAFFTSGYEFWAGLVIALGDFFVVMFCLLFPAGKFAPRWTRFTIPLLVITLVGVYLVPDSPFYQQKLGIYAYMGIMLTWYFFALVIFSLRYGRQKNLLQRQQTLWVMIGLTGPLVWFILFNNLNVIFGLGTGTNDISAWLYGFIAQIAGIFLFLMLPFSITISIARSKLFDIDLLINRSLVYLGLTIALGIIFASVLIGVSFVFKSINQGEQSMLAVTVSALAAGALFQPARRRLQRFVDQFFYHIKIDYQKTPVELRKTDDPLKDTTLSSYRGLKLIGRGGMADVYRAESPTNGREVAIKVLPPSFAEDEQFRRRFMREAKIVAGLQHPNIVEILNYGEENGTYYIVMEYLNGPDLRTLLKENKRIPLADFLPLLRDTVSALEYAHTRGLVHRDIKPSNIMLDTTSLPLRAVLTDFGIAKIADAHTKITATGVLGTFDYIAPEQIQASGEVDASADQYALGVMTYQMLTGKLPFERPNTGALLLAHLTAPPPDVRETVPETPRHVAYAIQRAMAKNPQDRYPSVSEFFQAIESASETP
jgi:tRNA A-37 threonylcarbamoyl transferase component Bud32